MTRREAITILGLSVDYSKEELKKRYRELMFLTHPDSVDEHKYPYEASDINIAYEYLLSNPVKNIERSSKKSENNRRHWDAKENYNAYSIRDILHNIEDADGEVIGQTVIASGRYVWTKDEEFSLFLRSLYLCSKNIIADYSNSNRVNLNNNIKLQADLVYLLSQQFVDTDMILTHFARKEVAEGEEIYHIEAMLETSLCQSDFAKVKMIYPLKISNHRLYVRTDKNREVGYISFKDDRLYYGIIPLFERKAAQVKMLINDNKLKRFNGKRYLDVDMLIRLNLENKVYMLESINLQIENLLKSCSNG